MATAPTPSKGDAILLVQCTNITSFSHLLDTKLCHEIEQAECTIPMTHHWPLGQCNQQKHIPWSDPFQCTRLRRPRNLSIRTLKLSLTSLSLSLARCRSSREALYILLPVDRPRVLRYGRLMLLLLTSCSSMKTSSRVKWTRIGKCPIHGWV